MKKQMPWFRFYTEALDDPKVQRLPPHLFKTWVNLLCLAGTNGGKFPSIDDIAFRLRLSPTDAGQQIDELILAGLIDIGASGEREPHNWQSRQFVSDSSTERVRKHRKQKEKQTRNADETLHETPPEQIQKQKTDAEITTSSAYDAPRESRSAEMKRVSDRLFEVAGSVMQCQSIAPGLAAMTIPMMWIESGADFERDVLPAVAQVAARAVGKRKISTWDYFTNPVAEAMARRKAGLPAVTVGRTPDAKPAYAAPTRGRQKSEREMQDEAVAELERLGLV